MTSRIPCPSKSGSSIARSSPARSNERVIASESIPASSDSRSLRCQVTVTSVVSTPPSFGHVTSRMRSSGWSDASASSISSRAIVVVTPGCPPTSAGAPTSIAVMLVPIGASLRGFAARCGSSSGRATRPGSSRDCLTGHKPMEDAALGYSSSSSPCSASQAFATRFCARVSHASATRSRNSSRSIRSSEGIRTSTAE